MPIYLPVKDPLLSLLYSIQGSKSTKVGDECAFQYTGEVTPASLVNSGLRLRAVLSSSGREGD
jgi:hypothetical protein